MQTLRRLLVGSVVGFSLVLVGCGGSVDRATSLTQEKESGKALSEGDAFQSGQYSSTPGQAIEIRPDSAPLIASPRMMIRTGNLRFTSDDVRKSGAEAEALVVKAGGFVATQNTNLGKDPVVSLTFRVPADQFDTVMLELSKVAKLVDRSVASEEVTSQVVDLDARIRSVKAGRDRLVELLAQAKTAEALITIETQLQQRETDIESMEAQRRSLSDQVSLSTIVITVARNINVLAEQPKFSDGLSGGWRSVKVIGVAGGAVIGVLIGFSPLIIAGVFMVLGLRRVVRRRKVSAPTVPGFVPPTPPQAA